MTKTESNVKPIKGDKISSKYSKELLLKFYDTMIKIRRFEERAGALYGMGLIGGFCHLYIGQEAVVTGVQANLKKGDQTITTYRDHGHMVAAGTDAKVIFAELMGRETGCSRGKGGSMHMFDLANGFYGGHGIVGANVPLGAGLAFANKYRGNDNISVTYFGDGAANQGQVYETLNMAALWNLPAIFIVENNEYAMGTSTKRSAANTEYYKRGEGFGVKGRLVNGMDVLEVYEAAKEAVDYVRSGKGPLLIEMKTYRYRGHSMSDPAKYRTKEEVAEFKEKKDPIINLQRYMLENNIASEDDFNEIDKNVKKMIEDAVEFSKNSPEPDANELFTDVLA
ncbi:MAG: pyruvate dehydrogenase (acetyl-transferring) E1 component subunit alpha [Rickettsiales bacterium]|nr:pyruvate dehydrogenase (acetyl-transferring) E1 component subunit alpha [Rickettsiales bacterium]